jgi:hypothetical protein
MTDFAKNIEIVTANLAETTTFEMSLEDTRINVKLAAIERIMRAGDNPLTGKPHSFSSAEAIVNTDGEYQNYLERLRQAAHNRIVARGAYDAAVAAARLQAGAGANV